MLSLLLPFKLRINCGASLFAGMVVSGSHFKKLILGINVFTRCDWKTRSPKTRARTAGANKSK